MTHRSTTRGATTIEDRLEPMQAAEGSGAEIADIAQPVDYLAYERNGTRHGWTIEPDDFGRYHALTLHWQEDENDWVVTAAQPFDTAEAARAWADRLDKETDAAIG